MLSTISWANYLVAILTLTAVLYAFLIFRYYSEDIKGIFSGQSGLNFFVKRRNIENIEVLFSEETPTSKTNQAEEDLSVLLIKAIEESSKLSFSKEELAFHLKLILREYPDIRMSSLREKINGLMVSECEKHPQMIITYAEVDGLWDGTI